MQGSRRGPIGPLLAGAIVLFVGLLGVFFGLFAARGVAQSTPRSVHVPAETPRSLTALADRADQVFFPGTRVLATYTRTAPNAPGGAGAVIAVIGKGALAHFFIMEYVTASTPGTVGGTNESGWSIPPVSGSAAAVHDLAHLGPPLRSRVAAWLHACGTDARPVAVWPFSDGALAVARLNGQYVAAQFLNASPRYPGQLMGPTGACANP